MSVQGQAVHGVSQIQITTEPQGTVEHVLETLVQIGEFLLTKRQRTQNEVLPLIHHGHSKTCQSQDQTLSFSERSEEKTPIWNQKLLFRIIIGKMNIVSCLKNEGPQSTQKGIRNNYKNFCYRLK